MVSVGEADFLESHSFYEDLLGLNTHRTIPAPVSCVVVAIARNCASTSNVFCRNIDNSGSGEGEPFQLRKLENRSFWKNEEVTNEGIKFGCLLEYRVVTCRQSFLGRYCDLGEQDGKQFIFHKRTSKLQDVDKILLDLQDDESVHEGLKEELECYSRKDVDRILWYFLNLIFVHCEDLREALKCFNPTDVDGKLLNFERLIFVHCVYLKEALKCFNRKDVNGKPLNFTHFMFVHCEDLKDTLKRFKPKIVDRLLMHGINFTLVDCDHLQEALKCFNPKGVDIILLNFTYLIIVHCAYLKGALKCFNPKDVDGKLLNFTHLIFVHCAYLKEALKCFKPKVVDRPLMYRINIAFVYCDHLQEVLKCFNPKSKFPRLQAYSACTRIFFIGIRAGTINNERVTLETMSGEWLDMPLNCRESQVLSTEPVHLQLKRPWDVADDDVGGVAVVKYEAGEATCEGLILRYKPYIISRDEEPVEMQNAFGEVISVRGLRKVLFDTGNEVGTGISRELLLKMNLQPDPKKKKKVELIGEESREFETVQIELVVRGHHFSACGLVDAVAKDTYLLVGMDIIQQLYDRGYTIGN